MVRWLATLLIGAIGLAFAILKYGLPTASGIDTGYALGRIFGFTAFPFILGAIVVRLWGWLRKSESGRFHPRLNWIAAIALVLSIIGNLAPRAG